MDVGPFEGTNEMETESSMSTYISGTSTTELPGKSILYHKSKSQFQG